MVKVPISVCIVLLFVSVPGSFAQGSPTPPKAQEVKPQGYPVMLGDQTLFNIREGVGAYSAEDRAKDISERIKRFAEDPTLQTLSKRRDKNPGLVEFKKNPYRDSDL